MVCEEGTASYELIVILASQIFYVLSQSQRISQLPRPPQPHIGLELDPLNAKEGDSDS